MARSSLKNAAWLSVQGGSVARSTIYAGKCAPERDLQRSNGGQDAFLRPLLLKCTKRYVKNIYYTPSHDGSTSPIVTSCSNTVIAHRENTIKRNSQRLARNRGSFVTWKLSADMQMRF